MGYGEGGAEKGSLQLGPTGVAAGSAPHLKCHAQALEVALAERGEAMSGEDAKRCAKGFTPQQRFFLAWAQVWRDNVTKERALQMVTLDPHGPHEMRTNGPLANMPEFHEAFGVKEGDNMWRGPFDRVDIW